MAISTPLTINGMTMPNRTFFAPMTRRCADPTTRGPTEAIAQYYARRAAGGFGLIITEGVFVNNHNAMNKENCPMCRTDEQIAMWKHVVDTCKKANPDVKMCLQLWHVGVWSIAPIGPSAAPVPVGFNTQTAANADPNAKCKGATQEDLDSIIDDFVQTAVNAVTKCGFDSVQVHGAHGYFVDIFSDVFYNQRKAANGDKYSDESHASRAGFGAAIVAALRAALGPKVPILFRFSQWEAQNLKCIKFTKSAELKEFLLTLQAAGVDGFDVSTRLWSAPAFVEEDPTMGLAAWSKKLLTEAAVAKGTVAAAPLSADADYSCTTVPAVLAVGGLTISRLFLDAVGPAAATAPSGYELTDPTPCLEALAGGAFDGVGIGRCALTNPDWPNKVIAGKWAELKAFTDADKEYGQVDN